MTRYATFEKFMLENCRDPELAEENLKYLKPVCVKIESGEYLLEPLAEMSFDDIIQALSLATGIEVKKVIPLSLSSLFPKPEWMSEHAHKMYRSILEEPGCSNYFVTHYLGTFYCQEGVRLARILYESFSEIAREQLGGGTFVESGLYSVLVNSFWFHIDVQIQTALRPCLDTFSEVTFVGDRKSTDRLKPLLGVMLHAFPWGELRHEPGSWLIFVA